MPVAHDLQAALVALLLCGQAWYLAATTTLDAASKMLRAGLSLTTAPLKLGAATGQRVVGQYVPHVSRALSLDAALSAPPARLPSPAAPLIINPTPFAEPPPHEAMQPQLQLSALQFEAALAEGEVLQEAGAAADKPFAGTSPVAAAPGSTEASSAAAPAKAGQHRRVVEEPAGQEMEGAPGDEEDRVEAGYDLLGSVPPLSVAPSGTADGLAAYMARQLSAAQREAEQEPLLSAPTSTAAATDVAANEAAAAAAAAFAREAAAAGQPRRPPSVENAEGADRLLAGDVGGSAGTERDQAAGRALQPAVQVPAALPPSPPEGHLPPVPVGPYPPPAKAPQSPATAPALPEAAAALPLPASPGELLRSQTGPLEDEGEEEAPLAAVRSPEAAAPPLPAQPRPPSAEQAGFTTGPSPLALNTAAATAAASAGLAGPGGMPEGLAEPLESPPPPAQMLPLDSAGSGSASSSGANEAVALLPPNPAASVAGNPFSPGTPALAAPLPAGQVLKADLEPANPVAPPPNADNAKIAFTAELAAAAHDLIHDG